MTDQEVALAAIWLKCTEYGRWPAVICTPYKCHVHETLLGLHVLDAHS